MTRRDGAEPAQSGTGATTAEATVVAPASPGAGTAGQAATGPGGAGSADPGTGQATGAGGGDGGYEAPAPLPPWQRVPSDAQHLQEHQHHQHGGEAGPEPQGQPVGFPAADEQTVVTVARPAVTGVVSPSLTPAGAASAGGGTPTAAARTSVNLGAASAGGSGRPSAPGSRRPGRGPRRASLQVKRIDPWSVLKLALVLSIALFFVWLVAVGVLYGVLNGMGVWEQLNGTYDDLVQGGASADSEPLISAGRVFGVAAIIGAVNIVLMTALATVAAFIYNVSADLAGGLEITLSERE
ncbi:DUF3566 domain-containing protein [Goodfellowiella coeruleoviolacea]|nr:DUF3566 domain-containing protein [Goodfellowiella coeruleoviolacea]